MFVLVRKNACVLVDIFIFVHVIGLIDGYFGSASNAPQEIKLLATKRVLRKYHLLVLCVFSFTVLFVKSSYLRNLLQVESFWSLWTHLNPPSSLAPTTDYLLFHSGVRRPVWEDPLNISGGKWIIRFRKGVADRIWEDIVLAIIGDQFDECKPDREPEDKKSWNGGHTSPDSGSEGGDGQEWPEICGATLSVRASEDILSVWNKVDGDMKFREQIRWVHSTS